MKLNYQAGTAMADGSTMAANPQFIARFKFGQLLRSGLDWLRRIIAGPFTEKKFCRVLALSPPFMTRQYFYDRKRRKLFSVGIRDAIDWATAIQTYYFDDYGLEKLVRHKELAAYYEATLRSGKTPLIIDCGGHIGLASRYFSDNYPRSKILCIEPNASNISLARKNNNKEVVFFEGAIGSTKCRGRIVDPGLGSNAYRMSYEGESTTDILSVNELLERYDPSSFNPFLIKIDIEGFESELFSKNTEWIDKFPLLIIELHDWMLPKTANSRNFLRAIAQSDRDFVFHGENIFSISNLLI